MNGGIRLPTEFGIPDHSTLLKGSETIGPLPVLVHFLDSIHFIDNINSLAGDIRSNGRRWDHGRTAYVFLLFLCTRPHVLYRCQDWVNNSAYLRVRFPDILGEFFTEARIGDTLDAIQKRGINTFMFKQCADICDTYKLEANNIFVDLTNFTVYGEYQDSETKKGKMVITFGNPKSHRTDLKQFSLEIAVTDDGNVPIYFQTLDGNTADVTRYCPMMTSLQEILGKTSFMTVGDCKLSAEANLTKFIKAKGFFLAPEFLTNEKKLLEDLSEHGSEEHVLLTVKHSKKREVVYSGFETAGIVRDTEKDKNGKVKNTIYPIRRLVIHSSQLEYDRCISMDSHVKHVLEDLEKEKSRSKKKKYKTQEELDSKVAGILAKYNLVGAVQYTVSMHQETVRKQVGIGRPKKDTEYIDIKQIWSELDAFEVNQAVIEEKKRICGYFVLVTNQSKERMSLADGLRTYKSEHNVEGVFHRLKSTFNVMPMRLHNTERIEAEMFLLMTGAQIYSLIDRTAARNIEASGEPLEGLFPKGRTSKKPTTEFMFDALHELSMEFTQQGDRAEIGLGHEGTVQHKILELLQVDKRYYSEKSFKEQFVKAREFYPDDLDRLFSESLFVHQ
jgi:transposase